LGWFCCLLVGCVLGLCGLLGRLVVLFGWCCGWAFFRGVVFFVCWVGGVGGLVGLGLEHSESLGVFASESCFVGCLDEVWVASELVFSAPGFYHGVSVHYDRLSCFDWGYGEFSFWSLSVDEEVFLEGV